MLLCAFAFILDGCCCLNNYLLCECNRQCCVTPWRYRSWPPWKQVKSSKTTPEEEPGSFALWLRWLILVCVVDDSRLPGDIYKPFMQKCLFSLHQRRTGDHTCNSISQVSWIEEGSGFPVPGLSRLPKKDYCSSITSTWGPDWQSQSACHLQALLMGLLRYP